MALRLEELAKTIDHSVLDPSATAADVDRACAEARGRHVAAVCVTPFHVERAAAALRGCDVKVATVISHPYGTDVARIKVAAAEQAIANGAEELDVVMNVGALRSGELLAVRDELVALARAVRVKSVNSGRGLVIVKTAVECDLLDDKHKQLACKLAEDAGADFVSATSAFGAHLVAVDDVELLRDALPESIGVKASGAIRTFEDAEALIAAGAARLGTPFTGDILASFAGARKAS